jgi:hypothetical protein
MFGKTKTTPTYTIEAMAKDIDAALVKAQAAFVNSDRIVDLLESRTAAIRAKQAANYSSAPTFHSGNL